MRTTGLQNHSVPGAREAMDAVRVPEVPVRLSRADCLPVNADDDVPNSNQASSGTAEASEYEADRVAPVCEISDTPAAATFAVGFCPPAPPPDPGHSAVSVV